MESVSVQTADETSENVAKSLLNTFKNCSFELCLLALENLFKSLNRALDELQSENLKLSRALESISSNIFSLREIQSDRKEYEQQGKGTLVKMLALEICLKAIQIR